jgi:hypothetical protein
MSKTPLPDWPGSIPRQRFDNLLWTWHVEVLDAESLFNLKTG